MKKPKGHKRACKCPFCKMARKKKPKTRVRTRPRASSLRRNTAKNPRTRGLYTLKKDARGVVAVLALTGKESSAWARKDYRLRNNVLRKAMHLSKRHQNGTVIIKSASGRELERWRGSI